MNVIVYQTPEGTLMVSTPEAALPGWVAVTGPMSPGEAQAFINGPAGQTATDPYASYTPPSTGSTDWASEQQSRAEQDIASQRSQVNQQHQQRQQARQQVPPEQGYSTGDDSVFSQNQQQATQNTSPGGGWSYGNSGKGRTTAYTPPVPPVLPSGAPAQQPGIGGIYNGGNAYTPGGNNGMGADIPMTQLGGWLTGGDFTPQQLMDPLVMTDEWLERTTGGDQHANKGYLRDAFSSYPTLYGLMNPGQVLDPMQQGQFGGDFIGGLSGSTGGNYVDARGLWDQQFGGSYGSSINDQTRGSDNQGQDQYQMVQQNVAALAQWMGPQGVQMAMNLIDNAWIDYNQMGTNPGMSFIDYLRSIGADQWF